jgi:hypothetical protein
MAHAHHHHHDSTSYYVEQLFTIAVCGAMGAVAVLLWSSGRLSLILHPKFHVWVLGGGVTLLILSGIRAISLWYEVDKLDDHDDDCCELDHDHAHDHSHSHEDVCCGHDHAHEHEHQHVHAIQAPPTPSTAIASLPVTTAAAMAPAHQHDHDHDHSHEHGWSPWRFVVLLLPVGLYMLNIPSEGIRAGGADDSWDPTKLSFGNQPVVARGEDYGVGFGQLEEAARRPEQREYYTGKRVRLTGRFFSDDPRFFRLIRYRIQCCAADAVPLNVTMMVDPKCKERLDIVKYNGKWVEVSGYVHFLYRPDTDEYRTAVILRPGDNGSLDTQIQEIPPPADPYVS